MNPKNFFVVFCSVIYIHEMYVYFMYKFVLFAFCKLCGEFIKFILLHALGLKFAHCEVRSLCFILWKYAFSIYVLNDGCGDGVADVTALAKNAADVHHMLPHQETTLSQQLLALIV